MDSQNEASLLIIERCTKVSICTSLGCLDGNLGIVMNKLHCLWEKHPYKEDSSLILFVHTISTGSKANARSSAVKTLSEYVCTGNLMPTGQSIFNSELILGSMQVLGLVHCKSDHRFSACFFFSRKPLL